MNTLGRTRAELLRSRSQWLIVALALSLFLLGSITTALHRTPWADEGWFADPAYNLAHHDRLGTTNLEPTIARLTRIDQHTYWVMPLFLLGQGIWYEFVQPTVLGTRMYTTMWALLALAAFSLILRHLVPEKRPGVIGFGVLLLATDYIFINNSAFARPDMMCCSLGLIGIASYVQFRTKQLAAALVAGNAFVALSGLTHPNGLLHFAGLWFLVLWSDRRRIRFSHLLLAAVPYLVCGAAYGWYIRQDTEAFRDQMLANGRDNDRLAISLNPLTLLAREFRLRYVPAFGWQTGGLARLKALVLLSYLVAAGSAALNKRLRSEPGVRPLLLLLALYFAIQCVFNQKLDYYLVHIIWIYVALLAVFFDWLWQARRVTRPWIGVWVATLIAVQVGGICLKARLRSYHESESAAFQYIRQNYPHARLIFGSAANLFDMNFDPVLMDDPYLGARSGKWADLIIVETIYRDYLNGWKASRPDEAQRIEDRLSHYRLLYDHAGYQIYGLSSQPG